MCYYCHRVTRAIIDCSKTKFRKHLAPISHTTYDQRRNNLLFTISTPSSLVNSLVSNHLFNCVQFKADLHSNYYLRSVHFTVTCAIMMVIKVITQLEEQNICTLRCYIHPLNPKWIVCGKTSSHPNVSIHSNQQLMHLYKITVISGITLWAHFSLGITKLDTLSNLLLTLISIPVHGWIKGKN